MVPIPTGPAPNQAGHAAELADVAMMALEEQWVLSDSLFETHVPPSSAHVSPIHLRNPYIFYMGHLPSFASTRLLAPLSAAPRPDFDTLFLRGRDPDVDGPDPGLLEEPWPSLKELQTYRNDVRQAVRAQVAEGKLSPRVIRVVAEHEAMHVETLYHMISQNYKTDYIKGQKDSSSQPNAFSAPKERPSVEWVEVPAGSVKLGRDLSDPGAQFGWDNEGIMEDTLVKTFKIARHAVSVAEFARFIAAGGYENASFWLEADWEWVQREGLKCPAGWVLDSNGNVERVCTSVGPGTTAAQKLDPMPAGWTEWPVSASLAEARAYAKWMDARIPTEAEWVRATFERGIVDESHTPPLHNYEGVHVQSCQPISVRQGIKSWSGAVAMIGNGWELTESMLSRFEGFVEMEEYPEYSADFFDEKHFVLKGASWATPRLALRRSFRNYYQARYPYVFSKVRIVRDI